MGQVALERSDLVIVTSDNPRSEEPLAIIQDVLQGTGLEVEIDPDRRTAICRAIGAAEPGDVVVIAGKGHEQGQEGRRRRPSVRRPRGRARGARALRVPLTSCEGSTLICDGLSAGIPARSGRSAGAWL